MTTELPTLGPVVDPGCSSFVSVIDPDLALVAVMDPEVLPVSLGIDLPGDGPGSFDLSPTHRLNVLYPCLILLMELRRSHRFPSIIIAY
jgi:hypothetical protein